MYKNFKEYTLFYMFNVCIFLRITYTILYIQSTNIFKEYTQFCTFNIRNFSNNVRNSTYSRYTNFQIM